MLHASETSSATTEVVRSFIRGAVAEVDEGVPDLPRVVVQRLPPLCVPLHHRRVLDTELPGQVLDHRPWHRERILQEQPDVPDRAHLKREAELMMLRPPQR